MIDLHIHTAINPSDVYPVPGCDGCRLIAAAPDLLAALDFLTQAARTEPGMAIYAAHLAQAEDAIRKARGQ